MKNRYVLVLLFIWLAQFGLALAQESENLISMSFREADLDYVLDFFSRATGYTIVKDAEINARVTIISQKDISVDEAFSVLNSIMAIKGYTCIVNGKIVKVVPIENAKQENIEINVGTNPEGIKSEDTIVTQIMPLSYTNASQIVKDLKDLVPRYGVMLAHVQSNTLIITAASSNIKHFAQIIKELDIPMSELIKVEVFIIKYRDVENLAKALEDLFEAPKGTSATTQAEQERLARIQRFRGPQGGPGQDQMFGPPGGASQAETPTTSTESEKLQIRSNVKIVADADTNSLIVSASKENIELIRELIEKLDREITNQPETRVFMLKYSDAVSIADELNELFQSSTTQTFGQLGFGFRGGPFSMGPGQQNQGTQTAKEGSILGLPEINVVADERTNSIVVTTTSQQMESIGQLINFLDKDVSEYEQTTVVFPLENAEASDLAGVLNELFQTTAFEQRRGRTSITSSGGGVMGTAAETIETARGLTGNVKIVAEETTNSLIITTYKRNLEVLGKIIKELDIILPQVLIEAKIVEVTLNDSTKFGVEWMWEKGTTVGDKSYTQKGNTAFGLADEIYGLKYRILGQTLESLLLALEKNTKVNILSTPRILTLDNHEAIINIGQEVPYLRSTQETTTGGILTSYDYRDVGVILTVTPRINKSETVTLDVNQQINSLVEFTLFNAPVITKREATASVTVKDGQTMIIGGIIEDNKVETVHKIPILGSIPFIGKLFQREEKKSEKTELMVFITPHIIQNPEEAIEVTQKQQSSLKLSNERY